eukprot:242053-Hanusia_phi.AAC.1
MTIPPSSSKFIPPSSSRSTVHLRRTRDTIWTIRSRRHSITSRERMPRSDHPRGASSIFNCCGRDLHRFPDRTMARAART